MILEKKKENLFEKFSRLITVAGTAIMMNLLFLAACIPVVTIGQAWCGLLGAIRYNIRGDSWLKGFWVGFKTRWIRGSIVWIIGLFAALFLLNDMRVAQVALQAGDVAAWMPMIGSCVAFAVAVMLLMSALCLNVYIPTDVMTWTKNIVNLLFKGFFGLLVGAGLFWAPMVVFCLYSGWIVYELAMVLVCAYFAMTAFVTTALMKNPLIYFLLQARADGTLTAEEGLAPLPKEDEDE